MTNNSTENLSASEKTAIAQHVTLVGMFFDIALGIIKVFVGLLSHSVALVADGIHSFTDVFTDIMVLVVTKYSRQEPDEDHPYGHERFETLGTVFLGSTLIAIAGAMAWDSVIRLISGESGVTVGWLALLAATASIVSKEFIYRYTLAAAKKINSNLLMANAWHSRSDAISSIIVLIALIGSLMGLPWLDAVAACIVGVFIAKIGWKLAWDSIKVLVDTAPSIEETRQFHEVIMNTDGVKSVHSLRCRHMGEEIVLDAHLQVAPSISVSEGHHIGLVVCKNLRDKFDHIKDITYHIDAEDDDHCDEASGTLPLRAEIIPLLRSTWQKHIEVNTTNIRLHYLKNQVQVELFIEDAEKNHSLEPLLLKKAAADLTWLGDVTIWYNPHTSKL